jgi:hypothetical protein
MSVMGSIRNSVNPYRSYKRFASPEIALHDHRANPNHIGPLSRAEHAFAQQRRSAASALKVYRRPIG